MKTSFAFVSTETPLVMEHATFSWGVDEAPLLRDMTLRLPAGKLVAVVGPVGAGKSSLISAFLGEMDRSAGRVNISGSVAYVSQQAWIQNATLKDNILFGKREDTKLYKKVIDACALKQDLDILAAGDQTEIGEKVCGNFEAFLISPLFQPSTRFYILDHRNQV
jgi:ATP-binding cassette subfamily C (CFTR/MRP) protein 1